MKSPKKIALLGFDCALTELVRKHIGEGICPNFKKVFENGTVAENCLVPYPTITPPNWTSMVTGAWPGTNNITDFWRHIPGTSPEGANTHASFNWDYVASESFWEAAERAGKKSVILNYPMSYNAQKKLKHGVVVGGAALTPGVYMDPLFVSEYKNEPRGYSMNSYAFCEDTLITTDIFPGNTVRIKFVDAEGWKNLTEMGDDPLEAEVKLPHAGSIFTKETTYSTCYVLVRELGNKGYDTVSLSPTKDFKDAWFTLGLNQWSDTYRSQAPLDNSANPQVKEVSRKAKLLTMKGDAENFSLYLSHAINTDGDAWCFPPEKAHLLNKGNNIPTNNTGMMYTTAGWYDLDTWMEQVGLHYEWMGDTAEALLGDPAAWDVFYSHAHPTDYIYHALMTELDPTTCSSEKMYNKAWELHRQLYRYADRYLGRLLKLMSDDTLTLLISDHGATPDGPLVDTMDVMVKAGLTKKLEHNEIDWLDTLPENSQVMFAALGEHVEPSLSKAIPQRSCYVYVNLKGRDPGGIVEPEDYEKVQREICDALMSYKHPTTGFCPFMLALPKREAMLLGLWGEQCGDVVYAVWPEYGMQHGQILPTSRFGSIGDLRTLCVFYGPNIGIKKGFSMERVCNLVDLVPTFSYITGWPIPKNAEGSVIYQIMEDIDFRPKN